MRKYKGWKTFMNKLLKIKVNQVFYSFKSKTRPKLNNNNIYKHKFSCEML